MNDAMAIGAIGVAFETDRSIPQDLKVIGYDDIEFGPFLRPILSTMRVSRDGIGRHAAGILLERLEQPSVEFRLKRIEPHLVVRQSTGLADNWGSQQEPHLNPAGSTPPVRQDRVESDLK